MYRNGFVQCRSKHLANLVAASFIAARNQGRDEPDQECSIHDPRSVLPLQVPGEIDQVRLPAFVKGIGCSLRGQLVELERHRGFLRPLIGEPEGEDAVFAREIEPRRAMVPGSAQRQRSRFQPPVPFGFVGPDQVETFHRNRERLAGAALEVTIAALAWVRNSLIRS